MQSKVDVDGLDDEMLHGLIVTGDCESEEFTDTEAFILGEAIG